jgi:hypothetical protein
MTDRELLQDAAKAAGIDLSAADWGGERDGFYWVIYDQPGRVDYWNPLTDDGDALRLAVKADFDLVQFGDFARADYMIGTGYFSVNELYGTDPLAATRRAIVRAAAEIGKEMK